uniref:Uncharacterized protein n=1 Tax=Panagrolaimus sp. JU765 TaxID=591449 RepID=A0AC34QNV9_9BILA
MGINLLEDSANNMDYESDPRYANSESFDNGDDYYKRDGMDIVLWTLQRALAKQMARNGAKDDDEEDSAPLAEPKTSELTTAGYSMDSLIAFMPEEKTELENLIEAQIGLPVMPFQNMD